MQAQSIKPFQLSYFYETAEQTASIFSAPQLKDNFQGETESQVRLKANASVTTAWGKTMKRILLAGVSLAAICFISGAQAADRYSAKCPYGGDPYKDYSQPWFGSRKVLRGGCWASSARIARPAYRNFFTPDRNDVIAGFRTCAL